MDSTLNSAWIMFPSSGYICRDSYPLKFKYTLQHEAKMRHSEANGLSQWGCEKCRQRELIESRDGGPSWSDVKSQAHYTDGNPTLVTRITDPSSMTVTNLMGMKTERTYPVAIMY